MTVKQKEQCPQCAASGGDSNGDNLVHFENGSSFCFSCYKDTSGNTVDDSVVQTITKAGLDHGEFKALTNRNISVETCIKYGYMVGKSKHIANFFDTAGNIVMQKVRYPDKSFQVNGDTSHSKDLYGAWLFTPSDKISITITEGELDCLSVAEAFDCKYPVVSLPCGAQGAESVIRKHLDYLQGFKHVTLAFDNDEPGRKATEACLGLFEPGKVRVAKWPEKDASDLLQVGRKRDIINVLYSAVEYMPETVKTDDKLIDALKNYSKREINWPFPCMNKKFAKIQIPAVYTLAGKPKRGKTTLMRELIADRIAKKEHVAIVSLEETIPQIVLGIASSITGKPLDKIRNRELTEEELLMCSEVAKYLVVYDHVTHGTSMQSIASTLPHMIRTYGCNIAVFDNISYAASAGMSDERKGMDQALIALRDSTIKYDYTVFNVAHMKRDDGFETGLSVERIFGSQGIERYSNYILGIDRDMSAESSRDKNTIRVEALSDRETGQDVGKFVNLFYNQETRRLEESGEILS